MQQTDATCGTCRFALPRPTDGEDAMECRLNPPVQGAFPKTSAPLWCGQHPDRIRLTIDTSIRAAAAKVAPARDPAVPAEKPALAVTNTAQMGEAKLPKPRAAAAKKQGAAAPGKGRGK